VRPRPAPGPTQPESSGKALLAAHAALVGGFVGYSVEHIGGSGDARLVYPLMAIGTGAGIGASLVIADEWDISEREARYIWAMGLWPTAAGLLYAQSWQDTDPGLPYSVGLGSAAIGLSLGSLMLNLGELQPGGDVLTHSGAALGAVLGGLGELIVEGDADLTPIRGIGIGLGAGVVSFGVLSPFLPPLSQSQILFSNLSGVLGGLAGAAVATPVLVGNKVNKSEHRLWLSSTAAGVVVGSVVGAILSRPNTSAVPVALANARPWIGRLGAPEAHPDRAIQPGPAVFGIESAW
jgi:hypothetical protein